MAMASTLARLCGHALFRSMVSFLIPYVLDHHVAVEVFDIIGMVYAAFQRSPDEEAFSFRVG